ncbi:glutathione S-transferase family protein [Roseibium sp.]|uniref:glutathione S-transferase family protein n=1 Tax=Roseibium sp. TaxID=1936156 RepID=UPI003A97B00D
MKVYVHPLSGHSHRVVLLLSLLQLPYEIHEVDLKNCAHKTTEFLKLNPFGQVPVIDDNGVILADSTAILVYVAKKYDPEGRWLPNSPAEAAHVQRWLSVAAGEVASGPAAARLVTVFGAGLDHEAAKTKAHGLLKVVDQQLAERDYLAGPGITIADIAVYSYVAHAPEGGVNLDAYPAVRRWLSRIETRNGFVAMVKSPVPAAA